MRLNLRDAADLTNVHDRKYFMSLYVRDPAEILIEYATDAPGFTVDEDAAHLGEALFVPSTDAHRLEDLKVLLPQFALPGEERIPMRDLHFTHRFFQPKDADDLTIVLLHGTGGTEADLMPIAHRIAPRATLLGVRGRSTEEGVARWFRRFDAVTFDQKDIRSEAEAFAGFIEEARRAYGLDLNKTLFLGYSNGANLLGAMLQLYPGAAKHAVLLRAIQVLDETPDADLSGTNVLIVNGSLDPFGLNAPVLVGTLQAMGANLQENVLSAAHGLTDEDEQIVRHWMAAL